MGNKLLWQQLRGVEKIINMIRGLDEPYVGRHERKGKEYGKKTKGMKAYWKKVKEWDGIRVGGFRVLMHKTKVGEI